MRRPAVIAHRGDWLEAPGQPAQNSVAAVLGGLQAGADGAEIDARLTADGDIVLHHDPLLGPEDARRGCALAIGTPICSCTRAELAHLATLEELFEAMAGRGASFPPVLNVEMKDLPGEPGWDASCALAKKVARLLVEKGAGQWPGPAGSAPVRVIVSSFDPEGLRALSREAPTLSTGLLFEAGESWRTAIGSLAGLRALHPAETEARPRLFEAAEAAGLVVVPWTVDDPGKASELVGLGAAALITNRPRALLGALS